MYSHPVVVINPPNRIRMLSNSLLQCPAHLSNVHRVAVFAGNLVHHIFLHLVWRLVLHPDKGLPRCASRFEDYLDVEGSIDLLDPLADAMYVGKNHHLEDGFFEQLEGTAMGPPLSPMGPPLSPIVANLFMESFKRRALQTVEVRPRVWLKYVDDVFAVWNGESEQQFRQFYEHLIHQHPIIQFTNEEEINGKIAFLDVLVERYGSGVRSAVFRKKMHTD